MHRTKHRYILEVYDVFFLNEQCFRFIYHKNWMCLTMSGVPSRGCTHQDDGQLQSIDEVSSGRCNRCECRTRRNIFVFSWSWSDSYGG